MLTKLFFKLFKDDKKKLRLVFQRYIEKSLLTTKTKTKEECITKVQVALLETNNWIYKNGIVFDRAKFEANYFS